MLRKFNLALSNNLLILVLSLIACLLSVWVIAALHGRINNDATLYLEMAKRFVAGDNEGALGLYNWPLFPYLMAMTHRLIGLDVQYSGHLLNTLFFGLSVWAFLTIIQESDGDKATIISAALLLFSNTYIVGDILPMIMRDQGFWAFHLLSLLFFLRFYQSDKWSDSLYWQITAGIATLFRVEAISFLILLPISLALTKNRPWAERLRSILKAYILPISLLIAFSIWLWIVPTIDIHKMTGRLVEIQTSLQAAYHQLAGGLNTKAQTFGAQVLGANMEKYAMSGLILTLIFIVFSNIAGACGWVSLLLCWLAPTHNNTSQDFYNSRKIFYWAIAINLLNLSVIILTTFLLSGRYAIAAAFPIIFFASFKLANIYKKWKMQRTSLSPKNQALFVGLILAISLLIADNLIQRGTYPDYEQVAGTWLKQHLAPNAKVFFDDARVRYYAGADWDGRETSWDKLIASLHAPSGRYDYLVLHIKKKRSDQKKEILKELSDYNQIQQFQAENGDKLIIFEIVHKN